ncbi:MAG: hypothetical protein J2P14_11195, partial [Acidothermales bacterium]|nr:hypothetical protein [Acidothermales bacterium]
MAGPRRLVLAGSVVVDIRLSVPDRPRPGRDVLARRAHAEVGGGFAVLAAARRHGLPAAYAGRHGAGPFGAQVRATLAEAGVELLLPRDEGGDSGFRTVLVEPDGRRSVVTSPGVEARLAGGVLTAVRPREGDAVHVSGHDLAYPRTGPAIATWLAGLDPGVLVVCDLDDGADVPWEVCRRVLRHAAVVTMTRTQARDLLGTGRPKAAFHELREYAPTLTHAVLRAGLDGAWAEDAAAGVVEVPAPPVDPVDETGGGGTHTGVLLAELARGAALP